MGRVTAASMYMKVDFSILNSFAEECHGQVCPPASNPTVLTAPVIIDPWHGYGLYSHDLDCHWQVNAPNGEVLEYKVESLSVEDSPNCTYDYLRLTDGSGDFQTFCGFTRTVGTLYSPIYIHFHSDDSVAFYGFTLVITPVTTALLSTSPSTMSTVDYMIQDVQRTAFLVSTHVSLPNLATGSETAIPTESSTFTPSQTEQQSTAPPNVIPSSFISIRSGQLSLATGASGSFQTTQPNSAPVSSETIQPSFSSVQFLSGQSATSLSIKPSNVISIATTKSSTEETASQSRQKVKEEEARKLAATAGGVTAGVIAVVVIVTLGVVLVIKWKGRQTTTVHVISNRAN